MHHATETLRELAEELRELLSQLGAGGGGAWQGSWNRCQELFDVYRADAPVPDQLPPGEREEFAAALEDVVRLNAVAVGLVSQETERLTDEMRRITGSKRLVRAQSDPSDTGSVGVSCDVRG